MAGFEFAFAFPFVERFSGLGLRGSANPGTAVFAASEPVITSMAGFALLSRLHLPGGPYLHTRASQIGADRLSTHSRGLLDLSQRPSQSSQGNDLLFLFVLQDIRHVARGYLPSRCCQCPGRFFVSVRTRPSCQVSTKKLCGHLVCIGG